MAKITVSRLHFFFCLSFFYCSVFSRTLEQIPKTELFNVSASIQRSIEILSFNPQTQQPVQQHEESDSSSFIVKLYSIDTLRKSPFKTYRDLTLSRLKRDSARLNFLYKKLGLASEETMEDLQLPITPVGFGFVAQFGIGSPPQQLFTIVDTGSDITWVQCPPCTNCEQQTQVFDPSKSSSYKSLSCDSQQCNDLQQSKCTSGNTCIYITRYGDGTQFSNGDFATETLTSGGTAVSDFSIGCGHEIGVPLGGAAGLFGLGRGSLSFPSQTKTTSFSYCLHDLDSTTPSILQLGSATIPSNSIVTPLLRSPTVDTFYYVGLTGISVGGEMLPIPPSEFAIQPNGHGGVVVDSGTTLTYFPSSVYNQLRDAFVKGTKGLPPAESFNTYDTCYHIDPNTLVQLPVIVFHFGPESMRIPPENYLRLVNDNNIHCFAFRPAFSSLSIIGIYLQQGTRVTYDTGGSRIAFSPGAC